MRGRFFRRIAIGIGLFFLFVFVARMAGRRARRRMWIGRGCRGFLPLAPRLPVLLVLGFVAFGRAIRRTGPIGRVMNAAGKVSASVRARRCGTGRRSRPRLALHSSERLEANEEHQRNLLADVAHELRTPLSVIRAHVEGMVDRI